MENTINIKIPVDYIKVNEEPKLLYRVLQTNENNKSRYEYYINNIHILFSEPQHLKQRLHDMIYNDDKMILDFLSNNQWILRFASKEDISYLCNNINFSIQKVFVDVPYSAYVDDNNKRVYTKKASVPIWQKSKYNKQNNLITWLFTDKLNNFDERIEALILSDKKQAVTILYENPWMIEFISLEKRHKIMDKIGMNKMKIDKILGYDEDYNLIKKPVYIPLSMSYQYLNKEAELEKLYNSDNLENSIVEYVLEHSLQCRVYDENDLIRNNIWLLNFLSDESKEKVYKLLQLETNNLDEKKASLKS